eukprot:GHVS01015624.1.p1 GENE.GHVS01015624.1~~GHVS01015624.1.p1  ORF type:complete len:564 (-),score=64.88 GHVS01015624.1:327-2018(-)
MASLLSCTSASLTSSKALRHICLRCCSPPPSLLLSSRYSSSLMFASVDPVSLSAAKPHAISNLVGGSWVGSKSTYDVVDPINGDVFIRSPYTTIEELTPFVDSMRAVPKSGLHNQMKNPERYVMYGKVMQKAAEGLHKPEVHEFFTKCIQRTMPKSHAQAAGEVSIIRGFCENFSGDSVRFLMRGFTVSGDHAGQQSHGYRWPYGAVGVISPYNFPLEIPVMQFLGALLTGNKPIVKTEATQGMPVEQFIRFLHQCGMPVTDMDFINTRGPVMGQLVEQAQLRLLQFTGSSEVAHQLGKTMNGRMRIEDAGYDWKILGGDVIDMEYVAWQCDQDAYAMSGQKCSAQSLLAAHTNWIKAGLVDKLKELAARRSLGDMTCSPVLSHTNKQISDHVQALASLPGSKVLFGGRPLEGHSVPTKYGAFEPTAVMVPLSTILASKQNMDLVTTELFGPVQVITEYTTGEENKLVALMEGMTHHLTAAVVSSNMQFLQYILGNTVNGTTYAGLRARTTGGPQNHWFGPGGDPSGAGIGSPEAILHTWTCHREIVFDHGPIPVDWTTPKAT